MNTTRNRSAVLAMFLRKAVRELGDVIVVEHIDAPDREVYRDAITQVEEVAEELEQAAARSDVKSSA